MRAVVERVSLGKVKLNKKVLAEIGKGVVVLLGVAQGDEEADCFYIADKIGTLRIFSDSEGKFNFSLKEIRGEILVVSQFTLLGDARKGRRPSFDQAASVNKAKPLYQKVIDALKEKGFKVGEGEFGAKMTVEIVNDGPVTILLDSKKLF